MRNLFLLTFLVHFGFTTALAADKPQEMVLVGHKNSPIIALSPSDIRRLYLGVPLLAQGLRVMPIRNDSDPLMVEVFLQNVVFMSGPAFERQLLSRVYRQGGQQPEVISQQAQLLNALSSNATAVTFMWADTAIQNPELKVIASLWTASGK